MGRAGRPTVAIELSDEERETLRRWTRRHSSSQALALRSRIVLAVCRGQDQHRDRRRAGLQPGHGRQVAAPVRRRSARRSRRRPAPGAARQIGDEVVEAIVVETLETTPKDATHWSTRALAERHGISRQTVSEIWRAFGLKPWRQDEFKVSPDPDLIEKIRDLVGSTCPRRSRPRSSRSMRSPRSRPSTGPHRPCRCCPPPRPRPPTTTSATAPWTCSPPWRSPPARSSPTYASPTPPRTSSPS